MKKFLPLLFLFVFSCQSLTNIGRDLEPIVISPDESASLTHDQFESHDLVTAKDEEKKIKVALLLPFSGKHKKLGWSLFNAASISLFDNDHNHIVELVLFDSKETSKETEDAFERIIASGIKVVIGPVFSRSLPKIEKKAKDNEITVISLSNNQALSKRTNSDGGVFLAGILPESQMDRVVEYAMDKGKFNFATIAPNSQYGRTISTLFSRVARDRDGNMITSEFYSANGRDVDRVVARVVKAFSLPANLTLEKGKLKKDVKISYRDRIYPQVIFIPQSGKMLSKITSALKKYNRDERDFQIVGTSQWDDASTLKDTNLLGAWFPAPVHDRFRNFERAYHAKFKKYPPRISSIIYDLTAAVIEVSNRKGRLRAPEISDFVNYEKEPFNGFDGIDGLFRFLPNGLVQRNLAIIQVGNGKFDIIDRPVGKFLKY